MLKKFLLTIISLFIIASCTIKESEKSTEVPNSFNWSIDSSKTWSVKLEEKKILVDDIIPESENIDSQNDEIIKDIKIWYENKKWENKISFSEEVSETLKHDDSCDTQWILVKDNFVFETCTDWEKTKIKKYSIDKDNLKLEKEHLEEDTNILWMTEVDWTIYWISPDWIIVSINKDTLELESADYLSDEIWEWKWITNNWNEVLVSNWTNTIFVLDKDFQIKWKYNIVSDIKIDQILYEDSIIYASDNSNKIYKIMNEWSYVEEISWKIKNISENETNDIVKSLILKDWKIYFTWKKFKNFYLLETK